MLNAVTDANLEAGSEPITLKWKGSKIPRGHSINGVEIVWTQHGVVTGAGGVMLGTYERLQEWGGPDKDEHVMLIVPTKKTEE